MWLVVSLTPPKLQDVAITVDDGVHSPLHYSWSAMSVASRHRPRFVAHKLHDIELKQPIRP